MQIIDAHVHLYPTEIGADLPAWIAWAESAGEPHWAKLCTRLRKDGRPVQGFPGVDELLREMDRAGIARAVLLGWYWENAATCAWQNRFYASCVLAHPDRLAAFATFHPHAGREATRAEVRRARDNGMIGIGELSPHSQGYGIDDPAFRDALALAGELKLPVNLHVTGPLTRAYPGRVETPLSDFSRLAREVPQVNFILAHWGGLLPLREPEAKALPNVYYDTAASPLLYDSGVWNRFLTTVGSERVLFGSDFPLNLYPRTSALAEMSQFVAEAVAGGATDAVLGGNAARLLGLDVARSI